MSKVTIFWFRRDLRLDDNAGLYHSLKSSGSVLPLFIFDADILERLEDKDDARVTFIHDTVVKLKRELQQKGSDLVVRYGSPLKVFQQLEQEYSLAGIFCNHDYEPSARRRDESVAQWARKQGLDFQTFKDQTIFEKEEILTDSRKAYTVYTPYKKKVLASLTPFYLKSYPVELYESSYCRVGRPGKMLSLEDLGFVRSNLTFPPCEISAKMLKTYAQTRDYPALAQGTSHLGLHLRFGTLSVRELAREGQRYSDVWLSELIWRDFFMQILWHFPHVETQSFRPEYDSIAWRNSKSDFQRWCEGMTGYPLVDAGMRELNTTGYMHNRVRMVVASFLCKHLLIHWYQGERYFARELLDYDLSANNGNWQWAAGSGCDAAPYFRIFNPSAQQEKFDPDGEYVKKWVPEWKTSKYPRPIIEHNEARGRCLQAFTKALKK